MSRLKMTDAGYTVGVNVRLTKRDKHTGRVLQQVEGHNRCLKMELMGITKFLNGEFNDTSYTQAQDWIPRYLGLGTNMASVDSDSHIKQEVQINDTRLLDEISPRLKLPDRNTVVNRTAQSYVQLVITTYLPEELYNGQTIREAGLFSKATGNNCLFRIVFDEISKERDSVVEVTWTISIISIDSQNEPYEEYSKADLREAINEVIERTAQLYTPYEEIVNDFSFLYEDIKNPFVEYRQNLFITILENLACKNPNLQEILDLMVDDDYEGALDEVNHQITVSFDDDECINEDMDLNKDSVYCKKNKNLLIFKGETTWM